mgnify:CR=1 FL=1
MLGERMVHAMADKIHKSHDRRKHGTRHGRQNIQKAMIGESMVHAMADKINKSHDRRKHGKRHGKQNKQKP